MKYTEKFPNFTNYPEIVDSKMMFGCGAYTESKGVCSVRTGLVWQFAPDTLGVRCCSEQCLTVLKENQNEVERNPESSSDIDPTKSSIQKIRNDESAPASENNI